MIKTLVLISQSYVSFASSRVLEKISDAVRVVLFIDEKETIDTRLNDHVHKIYKVCGTTHNSLSPALPVAEICLYLEQEIIQAGGSEHVSIFCQQEDNVLTAAKIREQFNIKGDASELVSKFRDKVKMKQVVGRAIKSCIPKHETLDLSQIEENPARYYQALCERLGQKLIIKPTTAAGSLNVQIIDTLSDFMHASQLILNDDLTFEYEIDEFIMGKMYQCDSFVLDGKVLFSGILELGCSNFDFLKGKPLSVYPVSDRSLYKKIFDFNQAVITALGFHHGSTHHELFLAKTSGQIIFLEIAARVPGGIGVPFHEKNSGVNLIDVNLLMAAGLEFKNDFAPKARNNVVAALLPVGRGIITKLNKPDIQSEYDIDWRVKVGMKVSPRSLIDTAGMLMLWNEDKAILRQDFERLQHYISVNCS